jgi:hypothetical protein
MGAANAGLRGQDPITGAVLGAGTAGLMNYAAPAVDSGIQSVFDSFSPDIDYAALSEGTRRTAGGAFGNYDNAGFFDPVQVASPDDMGGMLSPSYASFAEPAYQHPYADVNPAAPTGAAAGMLPPSYASFAEPAYQPPYALPSTASESAQPRTPPAAKEPSTMDNVSRLVKIGTKIAEIYGGQDNPPEDAPQREEGQSDADYAQALATYIQVDAQALADMGLVPGTPEYYDYLMSQLDATIEAMTGGLNAEAADLQQQLRGKTDAELTALRRALFVRGQLEQLMGSGTYTDPFTGRAEEVITNGRQVQPGVAAYHRGLGRTIGDFADLAPRDRQQAFGDFLGRDTDIYGMQARADAQAEKVAQAQALFEDMKRRRGMFNQSQAFPEFSLGTTGDPELDAIFGLGYGEDPALRMMFGQ